MNRRSFFRGLLAAACSAVAANYLPSALRVAATPRYVIDREKIMQRYAALKDERMTATEVLALQREWFTGNQHYTVRFALRDGTPSPTVQAWLDECGDIVTKHLHTTARHG